jgi:hypothetical protein
MLVVTIFSINGGLIPLYLSSSVEWASSFLKATVGKVFKAGLAIERAPSVKRRVVVLLDLFLELAKLFLDLVVGGG